MENKLIAKNPVAHHNYDIKYTIEAGIELLGTEIKSIRNGKMNLKDSYAIVKNGEVLVYGIHISPYEFGNIFNTFEGMGSSMVFPLFTSDEYVISCV